MRRRWWIPMVLLVASGGWLWWFRVPLGAWVRGMAVDVKTVVGIKPKPDPKTYASLAAELERWRLLLAARHKRAKTPAERAAAEHDARVILEQTLPAMMRCWIGTPWDFNGTAPRPGGGRIACGYFVSTVLMDAGFRVDRYQLAQQPSGNILRSFLEKDDCILTVGKPYDTFAADMRKAEPGIWLLGLDTHVAFLVVADNGFRMIHSSGSRPWCVVDEDKDHAGVLQRSNWRMAANLTADPKVIRRWLRAEKITVHGT